MFKKEMEHALFRLKINNFSKVGIKPRIKGGGWLQVSASLCKIKNCSLNYSARRAYPC